MALGSFTGMGFHFTIDINSKMNWCFFISRLALKENIILFEKVGFKLTKKIVTNTNYKEKASWIFRSLGLCSLYKREDSRSFPRIRNLTYSYHPNRCVTNASH